MGFVIPVRYSKGDYSTAAVNGDRTSRENNGIIWAESWEAGREE